MTKESIDCLVLGCTHYPYLIPQIRKIVGDRIQIIDSGEAVAKETKAILKSNKLLNDNTKTGKHLFLMNKNNNTLEKLLSNHADNIKIINKNF
jgi:glutamate racemase